VYATILLRCRYLKDLLDLIRINIYVLILFLRFRVTAGDEAIAEGVFEIRIYPSSFWEPLIIAHNKTLLVEESTSIFITTQDLEVIVKPS